MRISRRDTKLGCDRLQVSNIPKNPERGTEAEKVLGFLHVTLEFRSHSYCSTNVVADISAWSGTPIGPVDRNYGCEFGR
jgi:hypothetical protein